MQTEHERKPLQAKTINSVILKKMNEWIETIENKELRNRVLKSVIVTGGCIPSMMLGERVRDFDVYISDFSVLVDLTKYYVDQFKANNKEELSINPFYKRTTRNENRTLIEMHINDFEKIKKSWIKQSEEEEEDSEMQALLRYHTVSNFPIDGTDQNVSIGVLVKSRGIAKTDDFKTEVQQENDKVFSEFFDEEPEVPNQAKYRPMFLSENAITLSNGVQIITRFWGDAEKIHENFDFLHVQNYWTFNTKLVMKLEVNEAIRTKTLIYNGSRYPLASLIRQRKFLKRGWTCNAGEYLKMSLNLNQFDLTHLQTLRDQLTGVDLLYFESIISQIKEDKINDGLVDTMYLVSLINNYF